MLYPTLWRTERLPNTWQDLFNVRSEFDRLFDRWSRAGSESAG